MPIRQGLDPPHGTSFAGLIAFFLLFATSGQHGCGTSKWLTLKDGSLSSLQIKKKVYVIQSTGKQISPLFSLILPLVADMKIKISLYFLFK